MGELKTLAKSTREKRAVAHIINMPAEENTASPEVLQNVGCVTPQYRFT
jgi:hypothetical protein